MCCAAQIQDNDNLKGERSLSQSDVPQRFVVLCSLLGSAPGSGELPFQNLQANTEESCLSAQGRET
jgi:hypothetical protein